MNDNHPSFVEINLDAFSANLKEIRRFIGLEKKIFPIIKADAYGHGSIELSKRAVSDGYNTLVVGNLNEAIALRDAGIESNIIVLIGCIDGQEDLFIQKRLQPVIYSINSILKLAESAKKSGKKISVHIKVDTGMGRLGFPIDQVEDVIKASMIIPEIVIKGLLTHFSSAFMKDRKVTEAQINAIKHIIIDLQYKNLAVPFIHVANSAGILFHKNSYFDGVRPGIIIYGVKPSKYLSVDLNLKPVMSFKTRVIQLKEVRAETPISYGETFITRRKSVIATIPVGYAYGYARGLSNKAEVLIRGVRVPQVGTICMDMCMLDVTNLPVVDVGDEVVLFGKQGRDTIYVEEVAEWAGTIPYEILCQTGRCVRREYISGGRDQG